MPSDAAFLTYLTKIERDNDTLEVHVSSKLTLRRERAHRRSTKLHICCIILIFYFPLVRNQTAI